MTFEEYCLIDPDYPPLLAELPDSPPILSMLGNPACLSAPRSVGIVGARNASAAGMRFAESLSTELSHAGITVVSGLARGIDLIYVSPRTGRAVSQEGAGKWASRLLPLPAFLLDESDYGTAEDWRDGLRLTGHFLSRDVFGPLHRPLPAARIRLADVVQSFVTGPEGD